MKESSVQLEFLASYPQPTRKSYKNPDKSTSTYVNYLTLGLSLLYANDELDGVFLYKAGIDGFAEYTGPLPHGLKWDANNVAVVKLLGEPAKKTPKNNVVPIWLEYTDRGLTVNLTYKSYDDLDNPIASLALFPPTPTK